MDISKALTMSIKQYRYADEAIAMAILGSKAFGMFSDIRLWLLKRKLSLASDAERSDALKQIVNLIIPFDFFVYARLGMELTGSLTKKAKQE
jgi:hypothetical protein